MRRYIFEELKVPFAGDVAVFYPRFQDPNVGRWKYTAAAAKVAMDLMNLRVLGKTFLSSFLKYLEDNIPQGQKAARDMAGYAITAVEDPRVVVAFTFECEYVTAIYNKETAWLLANTSAGWPRCFGILELADKVEHIDKERNERLLADWEQVLPETARAIEAARDSHRTQNGDELASQLNSQIQAGAKAMIEEHRKNYAWLFTPKYVPLWMFCRGRSGSATRAVLSKLKDQGYFPGAEFQQPDMENEGDKYFVELLRQDGAAIELCQVCELWGLLDTSVEHSLKEMSKNMASTKETDKLVENLVAGQALLPLFDILKVGLVQLSISSLILEQRFSELKQRDNANQSRGKTDVKMRFAANQLSTERKDRKTEHGGSGSAKSSGVEINMLGSQMLESSKKKYSPDRMKGMTSRRQFKGALTKKDESEADRAAVETIRARAAQPKRQKTSDGVWGEKQLQFTATPTAHEKSLKEAAELCDAGRVLAVLDERKFPGQTNNATKFYNSLNLVDLRSVLRQNFPILVGIAARIHFDFSTTQKTSLLSYIKALQPVFSVSAGGLVVSYLDERQQQYIKNYGLFVRAKKGYTLDQKQSGFVLSGSGKAATEAYKRSGQNTC